MAVEYHVDEKAAKWKKKVPSKSASLEKASSTRSASNSAYTTSRVHSDHNSNGGGHDSAPNAEILSILRTIQENQRKQDDRMAEIENMCCDYQYEDDYNDHNDLYMNMKRLRGSAHLKMFIRTIGMSMPVKNFKSKKIVINLKMKNWLIS